MKPVVAVLGGGMITHDQLLPSFYQLQRIGVIGDILVNALVQGPLDAPDPIAGNHRRLSGLLVPAA